ncbi:MAG: hypothetical protein HQM12_11145 [SAR324 cluster bacterium]|nr:hypothetical protein [SAR324 cluster bacterium]
MRRTQVLHLLFRFSFFLHQYRIYTVGILMFLLLSIGDSLFSHYGFGFYSSLNHQLLGPVAIKFNQLQIIPQVWLALMGMILGTLIIVISFASQKIPKLIDLYMQDLPSLYYVWFLVASGTHTFMVIALTDTGANLPSNHVFNMIILFPLALMLSLTYVFYILRYTKPSNIIMKVYEDHINRIHELTYGRIRNLIELEVIRQWYQTALFDSFNQLDDLLEFVSFKEPKADIIHDMCNVTREYIRNKQKFNPVFFKISQAVRQDISFKTMLGMFDEMERSRTFYEQKCFRLLGNAYTKFLDNGDFDLASLCASEMAEIGLTAIEQNDEELMEVIIVRFNTVLRFAIKHGIRNNEGRNLYNAAFHYGNYIRSLVKNRKDAQAKKCFMYLRVYGLEIFKHGRLSPAMYFIVDVFASEMKKLLILLYAEGWDPQLQNALLTEILQVDNPPATERTLLSKGILINNGVRILQAGLALFAMRENMQEFVSRIVKDITEDLDLLDEKTFYQAIDMACARLRFSGPTFWEDTDRGNVNIYYTKDTEYIDTFRELVLQETKHYLITKVTQQYDLDDAEAGLLWNISHTPPHQELMPVLKDASMFESAIQNWNKNYTSADQPLLESLRNKTGFTSENHTLMLSSPQQLAPQSELTLFFSDASKRQALKKVVHILVNTPEWIEVRMTDQKHLLALSSAQTIRCLYASMHQRYVYEFKGRWIYSETEDTGRIYPEKHMNVTQEKNQKLA